MKPRSVTAMPGLVRRNLLAVGRAADRHQHQVVGLRSLGRVGAFEGRVDRVLARLDGDRLGRGHDAIEARLVDLFPDAHQVAVRARHQAVHHLDHVQARAERRVDGAHFQADDAAADDQHALGHRAQFQRRSGIEDARILRNERQPRHLRTDGDDRLPEAHHLFRARLVLALALGLLDLDVERVEELADAAHDVDLAALRHAGEPAGELADDLVLPAAQLVEVDLRLAEVDAVLGQHLRFVHHRRHVQQRLGRNAADVQAHAAERRVALDQHDLHAEVGGAEGGAVAAGAGAEHQHVAVDVGLAGVGRGAGDRRGSHSGFLRRGGRCCRRSGFGRCGCRRGCGFASGSGRRRGIPQLRAPRSACLR